MSDTDAASCSIMLLSEGEANAPRLKLWGSTETLPSSALSERPGRGDSIAGWVLAQGTSLLIADIEQSKFAPMARNRSNMGTSFICTPIAVKNHVIGVMNLSSRPDHPSFNESHLVLADIVATLIGKSVQVERLQTLIRSRVAQCKRGPWRTRTLSIRNHASLHPFIASVAQHRAMREGILSRSHDHIRPSLSGTNVTW